VRHGDFEVTPDGGLVAQPLAAEAGA
jgi:hypothetical protein